VERFAIREVIRGIGVSRVYLVDEGLAAAIGAKLPVGGPKASMVVDIGGGTTSIAVVVNAGIIESDTRRLGGLDMDHAIIDFIKQRHRLIIGERSAERLKMVLGSAVPPPEDHQSQVKGLSLDGGPEVTTVRAQQIYEAIEGVIGKIVESVRGVLERLPPEVAGDLHDSGLILTGGMALLVGIDARLSAGTELPVEVAESPRQSVGRGLIALYDQPLLLRRVSRNIELA
jgi:rod shape-determining protein MreB